MADGTCYSKVQAGVCESSAKRKDLRGGSLQSVNQPYNSLLVRAGLMQIQYKLSERDLWESQRVQRGWQGKMPPFFGMLLVFSGIYTLAQNKTPVGPSIATIFVGVLVGFGMRLAVLYTYHRNKTLQDQFLALVSDEGIEISSSVATTKFDWKAFTKHIETKNLFLLFQGPGYVTILPKTFFNAADTETFRELLRYRIGGGEMQRKGLRLTTWIFIAVVSVAFVLLLMTIRNTLRQSPTQPAQTESTQ